MCAHHLKVGVRSSLVEVTSGRFAPLSCLLPGTIENLDRLWFGHKRGVHRMSRHSEACVAQSTQCIEVAEQACTAEERREFLTFADAWERPAAEIEQSERLVAFLDELTTNADNAALNSELPQKSYAQPLRQLAAAISAIPDRVASDVTAHHLSSLLRR
jgi:hypothetical protein